MMTASVLKQDPNTNGWRKNKNKNPHLILMGQYNNKKHLFCIAPLKLAFFWTVRVFGSYQTASSYTYQTASS